MRTLLPLALLLAACGSSAIPSPDGGSSDGGGGDMPPASSNLTIVTASGPVMGKGIGATRAFLGIPYAAPPVGALRWKPPQAPASWSAPRDATHVGPVCPQIQPFSSSYDDTAKEDCLTINVWSPSVAAGRPVMLFIHGGAFTAGSGGLALYDGQKLSEAGSAVIVTFNYRLGPLGFLGHPALTVEDPKYRSSGNYGIEDQRAAMRWVKDNIAAFGGDPANVTIFGESAGAQSVFTHLVSTESAGLFQRALAESGYYLIDPTQSQAEAQGGTLAMAAGCTQSDPAAALACLRAKSAKEIVLALPSSSTSLGGGTTWGPVVDGLNLVEQPFASFRAGRFARVPLLLGANANEGTLFLIQTSINSDADYEAYLTALVGAQLAAKVRARYPSSAYPSPKAALADVLGDSVFVCPTRRVARASAAGGDPTFLYHFTHAIDFPLLPGLGAFHSSELPFVFGTPYITFQLSTAEVPLSQALMGYWTRFAAAGDPNGGGAAAWPAYPLATDGDLRLDLTIVAEMGLDQANCDFWDGVQP